MKREVEWKLNLQDEQNHHRLVEALQAKGCFRHGLWQRNYYFDDVQLSFLQRKEMLRIRFSKQGPVLTHKSSAHNAAGLQSANETEFPLESNLLETPEAMQKALRESAFLQLAAPRYLGCLKNERQVYEWQGMVLELDISHFELRTGAFLEYELEVEADQPEATRESLKGLFAEIGIPFEPQTKSKFRRFLEKAGIQGVV